MKTVFSNSMLAHVWANQSQPFGRSGSMRMEGAALYSYDTPIAAHAPRHENGSTMYARTLVTRARYSMTTSSKHMPEVRRALIGYHVVPDIGYSGGRARTARIGPASDPASWVPVHAVNMAALVAGYHATVAGFMRLQSWHWATLSDVLSSVRDATQATCDYSAAFGIDCPDLPTEQDAARIWERCERLNAKRRDPRYAEKAEKAREAREAAKARKAEREAAERVARNAEYLARWREGGGVHVRLIDQDGGAYLRVVHRDSGDLVQTSQGAEVPVSHARRVFRFIDAMRKRAPDITWTRSDSEDGREAFTLGHFTLDRVDSRGIRAGCHFIAWREIERIAPLLNA